MLSREQVIAIFKSYPDMVVREASYDRYTVDYSASKADGNVIAHRLSYNGKGYINGRYMSDTKGYKVHPDGYIPIADLNEEQLRTLIQKAIQSMSH